MSIVTEVTLQERDRPGSPLARFQVNPQSWSAERGATGRSLLVPFYRMDSDATSRVLMISGKLTWHNETAGAIVPAQVPKLGTAHLVVPLTDEQLASIEAKRLGGPCTLDLLLEGLVAVDDRVVVANISHTVTCTIPHEVWLQVLDRFGEGHRALIELPALPEARSKRWSTALEHLRAASRLLAGGDPGPAHAEARIAIERFLEALGEDIGRERSPKEPFAPFVDAVAKRLKNAHADRSGDPFAIMATLIVALKEGFGAASETVHRGMNSGARADAELAIRIISTLYSYFAAVPATALRALNEVASA